MAQSIPTYQRMTQATGGIRQPRASSNVSPNSQIGDALGNVSRSLGSVAGALRQEENLSARKAEQANEDNAAVAVSNILSAGDTYWQKNTAERFSTYKVGDPDMTEAIDKDFDKWKAENAAALPTEKSRMYFETHATQMKERLKQGANKYQSAAVEAKTDAQTVVGQKEDENAVYNDPRRLDEIYKRRVEPMLARSDKSESEKIAWADKYKRSLYLASERGEMEKDPAGWYARRFGSFTVAPGGTAVVGTGANVGFDGVMERIFKTEGGYAAADGNTGQPVNFGINQGANPDIDVKTLTKGEAAKLYKTRYWDKIGGDSLPPALQGTAMDAAVNQGPENAKKWIAESGGDVGKFNDLRRAHYENLLAKPEFAKYRQTWMGRLAHYEKGGSGSTSINPETGEPQAGDPAVTPPKTYQGIDYEQQSALKRHAETILKQHEATFKAEADRNVRDAAAMHADGVMDPMNLNEPYFSRAYGEDGPRMYAEYQKSREMATDIGGFKTQSATEIRAELEREKPVPGAGYAADDARYMQRAKAAAMVMEQRDRDPAGYAVLNNGPLTADRKLIDEMQPNDPKRPAAVQLFSQHLLAEQQRLGIASPKLLTPQQADAIANQAMTASKPSDAANLVAGLEQDYGPLFPQVFQQLVKDGKVSAELLIIPNLPSPAAREMVSRMARIKESDLTAGIEASDQKIVKDAVTTQLESFAKAIPMMTSQAVGVTNSYETTIRKMAYQFTLSGDKPADAVEKATAMVLGHYEFDGTVRYPKGGDIPKIRSGQAIALDKDLAGIDVPRDLTAARNPAEAAAAWQNTVRSNAQWYTRDDDAGLDLWAHGDNGVRYRVTRGGKQVSYDWADLKAKATTESQRAMPATTKLVQDAYRQGDMRVYERLKAQEREARRQKEIEDLKKMRTNGSN